MNRQVATRLDALLREARDRIDPADAELLAAYALGRSRSWLFAHPETLVPPAVAERLDTLVARRARGEPVAYLTGTRGFWTFELMVTPDTLIPRPETELLVEAALARIPSQLPQRVADLGTGSGAVALALAGERRRAMVVATDRSDAALAVARTNRSRLGLGNVEFRQGDWFAPLAGERFDAIVSNPPYIDPADPHLKQGDLRFEPVGALTPGGDGLDDIRRIVAGAPARLAPGGWLLLEHGHDQGDAVRALMSGAGLCEVATLRDLEHRDRVTVGRCC